MGLDFPQPGQLFLEGMGNSCSLVPSNREDGAPAVMNCQRVCGGMGGGDQNSTLFIMR